MPVALSRLNHAVLYVRDLDRSVDFYRTVFAFDEVTRMGAGAAFLRASGGDNHHDLGLFAVGPDAPLPARGSVGLYHLAWQVDTIEDLETVRMSLAERDAYTGESSHGATKSIYGADPDGNELEVMWMLPREAWGEYADAAPVERLDLRAEIERWGGIATGSELRPLPA